MVVSPTKEDSYIGLHDVDKSSDNRGKPSLNTVDGVAFSMAHATSGIAYRTESNSETAPRVISKDDQIIMFDGTANKILIGRDGSGNWDVKIAQDGVDVLTATDAQLLFSGSRNTLQVRGGVRTATIAAATYSSGSNDDTATVDISSLGLTTTPMILAFYSTGVGTAVGLGSPAWGGSIIDFIGGAGTVNAFTLLRTAHTSTEAKFTRRFINNSGGSSLTAPQYNIAFIVCTQTAS